VAYHPTTFWPNSQAKCPGAGVSRTSVPSGSIVNQAVDCEVSTSQRTAPNIPVSVRYRNEWLINSSVPAMPACRPGRLPSGPFRGAIVEDELLIRLQGIPVQHRALLKVPGPGAGQHARLCRGDVDQDNVRHVAGGDQAILERHFEQRELAATVVERRISRVPL